MKKHFYLPLFSRGVAALFVIIVVATASFIMAYGSSLLGIGDLDMAFISSKGVEAFVRVDGCVEEAMRRLRYNTSYAGGVYIFSSGSCAIIISSAGSDRTILAASNVDGRYFRTLQVEVTLGGDSVTGTIITINSWQELST